MQAGGRAQVSWRGVAAAVVVALVGGLVLSGVVFGFGLGGDANIEGRTDTIDSTDTIHQTSVTTVEPSKTRTSTVASTPITTIPVTATPTASPTPTPTETPTPTVTPTPEDPHLEFILEWEGEIDRNAQVPIRIRAGTVQEGTFYLVHNSTSQRVNETRKFVEWTNIALAYGATIRDHDHFDMNGTVPERIVVLEYNSSNLANRPAKFTISNDDVWALVNNSITAREYHRRWQNSIEPQTDADVEFATGIDRILGNITYYPDDGQG